MKRKISLDFLKWKSRKNRKPLVVFGARQTGKTHAIEIFGKEHFRQIIKIDFMKEKNLHSFFESKISNDPKEILKMIAYEKKITLDANKDLLFFDEIQDCPGAITSLKYFKEEMPELALIASGSYLGMMTNEESFPVGQVEFLTLTPLCFDEFLEANNSALKKYLDSIKPESTEIINPVMHDHLLKNWRLYCTIGGMPEVINQYFEDKNTDERIALLNCRKIQHQLLEGYRADFSKYSGTINSAHLLHVFNSIPTQLAHTYDDEVKKYKFSGVIPRQNGFEKLKDSLVWLSKARLSIKTNIANHSAHPLKAYCADNKFKLYFFDVGLLQASLDTPPEAIMSEELGHYKGFIAENFIAQELFHYTNQDLTAWSEGNSEIEFLITAGEQIFPLEVKSSARSRRSKSLSAYLERYKDTKIAYKITAQNRGYAANKKVLTLPFYLFGKAHGATVD